MSWHIPLLLQAPDWGVVQANMQATRQPAFFHWAAMAFSVVASSTYVLQLHSSEAATAVMHDKAPAEHARAAGRAA